MDFGSAMKRK